VTRFAGLDRIQISVIQPEGDIVVYDLERKVVIHELVDYALFMETARRCSAYTRQLTLYQLVRFWSSLCRKDAVISDVDDELLVAYAEEELASVLTDRSHRGSERAARSTVNLKLSMILHWLAWLQYTHRAHARTIGPYECNVTAEAIKGGGDLTPRPGKQISSPLFLRDAGNSGSRPSTSRPVFQTATRSVMEGDESEHVRLRNALFMDIEAHAGFRRGSICSLTTSQFPSAKLRSWRHDKFTVTPTVQKRNLANSFEVSIDLSLRVLDFIEGPREELIRSLKVGPGVTRDRIFLSDRSGKPITPRAMTQAISSAMRAAGLHKGQATHVLRGLFLSEFAEAETRRRARKGLDTQESTIAAVTAEAAGHSNRHTVPVYVSKAQSRVASEPPVERRGRNDRDE
jgi:integrase